jgi:hypothetical protein
MTITTLNAQHALAKFFGVAIRGRASLNGLYLLLTFPLGIAYFVFLAVGWSVGLGTLIVWIGLFILLAVLGLSWLLSAFERQQAIHLLGADVEPMWRDAGSNAPTAWNRFVAFFGQKVTWTGMLFLLLKFPLGVASFVVAVTTLSVSGALLLTPFHYRWDTVHILAWRIDTIPEALLCSLAGALLLLVSLHLMNGIAWIWKSLSRTLLGGPALSVQTAVGSVDSAIAQPEQ